MRRPRRREGGRAARGPFWRVCRGGAGFGLPSLAMRPVVPSVFALAATLAGAPAAVAATLHVDDGAAAEAVAPCLSPAAPCKTIGKAVTFARATPEADTIAVAPGLYAEALALDQAADTGLTVAGAGAGSDPATATIVAPAANPAGALVALGHPVASGLALRSLRVRHLPAITDKTAVSVRGDGSTVSDVAVEIVNDAPDQGDAFAIDTDATLERITVDGVYDGRALAAIGSSPFQAVVRDAALRSGTSKAVVSVGKDATVRIQRSILRRAGAGVSPVALVGAGPGESAALVADSSLLLGGTHGVRADANAGSATAVTLRHATIDAGAPGPDGAKAIRAGALAAGGTATVAVSSSIALEPMEATQAGGGTARIACTDSIAQAQAQAPALGEIACDAAGRNSPPDASLLPGLAAGSYVPALGSAAIDAGAAVGLAGDESPTDLAGAPRIADAGGDCGARRDRGAYELPRLTVTASAQPRQAVQPLPFTAAASGGAGGNLTFAWLFADGARLSGQSVARTFTAPGPQSAIVTATDPRGCSAAGTVEVAVGADTIRPVLARPALSRRTLARTGARSRARLFVTLSEPARLRLTVERAAAGRRVGRACLPATRARRDRPSCLRWARAAAISAIRSKAGRTSVSVGARIGSRRLGSGRYRIRLSATDPAGNRSAQRIVTLRVT